MASKLAVLEKRAKAELRLAKAVEGASRAFGATYRRPSVPSNRFPDLYAAELVEGVADFLEQITAQQEKK